MRFLGLIVTYHSSSIMKGVFVDTKKGDTLFYLHSDGNRRMFMLELYRPMFYRRAAINGQFRSCWFSLSLYCATDLYCAIISAIRGFGGSPR